MPIRSYGVAVAVAVAAAAAATAGHKIHRTLYVNFKRKTRRKGGEKGE